MTTGHRPSDRKGSHSPYVELTRAAWSDLAATTPVPLTQAELEDLTGSGDRIDLDEVKTIYLPLSRLLSLYVAGTQELRTATATFLGEDGAPVPYIIGIAGSVAVGKSTSARLLRTLLARWPNTPRVSLVTTDGFLYPNAILEERGIMHRKGFPESYDQRALLKFVSHIKSGVPEVRAPTYSHLTYDILPDQETVLTNPDVVIVEGLNVLQPARPRLDGTQGLAVSDYFDFSIFVDAPRDHIQRWYVDRFLQLRRTAFADPESYFHRYSTLSDEDAEAKATDIWRTINEKNLVENVLPTRGRATLVLTKDKDHSVRRVLLRKL